MSTKKTILLKLTGQIIEHESGSFNTDKLVAIIEQIKHLMSTHTISIVIGGGNFFRASRQNKITIRPKWGHSIGMLATLMNGLILQDICEQLAIKSTLFTALECPQVGLTISPQRIEQAKAQNHCLIFTGGTGNPYFTTDTTAVLRALQIQADELWKGTKVDGIYTKDPHKYKDAQLLTELSYKHALEHSLGIMDMSAFALAQEHAITMRVFNIFAHNALIKAATDQNFGSIIRNI